MKKQLITFGMVVLLVCVGLSGCFEEKIDNKNSEPRDGDIRLLRTEYIGGKYNASIRYEEIYVEEESNSSWVPLYRMSYTKDGRNLIGSYFRTMQTALDWIKTYTGENCTILCWWDYGTVIVGYSERNVIATFASLSLKDTLPHYRNKSEDYINEEVEMRGGWSSEEAIKDIATVLTSTNISSTEIKEIFHKYNVSYVLTNCYDRVIAYYFLNASGKNPDEYLYWDFNDSVYKPNNKANETLLFQMWKDQVSIANIDGLSLVYNDYYGDYHYTYEYNTNYTRIFKIDLSNLGYVDREHGFGFNPPDGWNIISVSDSAVYLNCTTNESNSEPLSLFGFMVGIPNYGAINQTLSSYVEYTLEDLTDSTLENFSLISHNKRTVNGMNAYEFVSAFDWYDNQSIKYERKEKLIFVEKNERIFNIKYWGKPELYDKYESFVNQSINSLTII